MKVEKERMAERTTVAAASTTSTAPEVLQHYSVATGGTGCIDWHTTRILYRKVLGACPFWYRSPVSGTNLSQLRRSTIEVHPNFSEAPRLRRSIPQSKSDFSENQIASRRIIPWPESTKHFFSTIRGQGTPFFRKKIAEMCYLYRRTGQFQVVFFPKRDCSTKRVDLEFHQSAGR